MEENKENKPRDRFSWLGRKNAKLSKRISEAVGPEVDSFQTLRKGAKKVATNYGLPTETDKNLDNPSQILQDALASREEFANNLSDAFSNPEQIRLLSRGLYASNGSYAKMIHYIKNMFLIRYKTIPKMVDGSQEKTGFKEVYQEMINVTAGANLDTIVPFVIERIAVDGAVYISTFNDTSSNSTASIMLPPEFCRTVNMTQYATNQIEFDFSYFDDFEEQIEADEAGFWSIFPPEFKQLYENYLNNEKEDESSQSYEWQPLDPTTSTSIQANDFGIPPLISSAIGISDYGKFSELELKKSEDALNFVITHEIPMFEGEPAFELPVIRGIQRAMEGAIDGRTQGKVLQTFGKTDILNLDTNTNANQNRMENAYKNIFNAGGLNSYLFASETVAGLTASIKADGGMIWNWIMQLQKFYNLALNNYFSFDNNTELSLQFLKVNVHTEKEDLERYINNAQFGIGKIDALVASGVNETTMMEQLALEQELNLVELLQPLSSSHTGGMNEGGEGGEGEDTDTETESEPASGGEGDED